MISIIVPVYKVEQYLPKCIESILGQTYRDLQIIIVDDGSPDKCPQICDEYAEKDSRITVIHQKNKGVSAARNSGLKIAKGEYVGFIDPDDFIDSRMYELMINSMKQTESDMAICGYDYIKENGDIDRKYFEKDDEILSQKELMRKMSDMPPTVRHGVVNKLFKKELIQDTTFIEGLHSSEDVYFLTECIQQINKAVFVHKPLYKNLVRMGSATHGGLSISSLADSFNAHDKMYEDIVQAYPELKNHSMAFLLDVCTLKYNEAKDKADYLNESQKSEVNACLNKMKYYIKKRALQAVFNKEIYWKTRIYYLIFR